uniref:Cysteine rich secreted protein n=1 Tax=Riptortus pedestris TaxID=329032 RepID=R4WCP1_RIPPE|nr:cysteine rich secreted protein [Riptortus pedestris]
MMLFYVIFAICVVFESAQTEDYLLRKHPPQCSFTRSCPPNLYCCRKVVKYWTHCCQEGLRCTWERGVPKCEP